MADWVTISALATAGGTFALAATTYAAVRSGNRAARAAEASLLADLRPLIVESFETDGTLHVAFSDLPALDIPGGTVVVHEEHGNLYVVFSLRNVGPGIGILHGGHLMPRGASFTEHAPLDAFRMLTRDIYIPPGKVGFWQIAYRDEQADEREQILAAVAEGAFAAEIMYGDFEGGQRVVTRLNVLRGGDGVWRAGTVRHWQVDRPNPR
jgi:hypothetical protein